MTTEESSDLNVKLILESLGYNLTSDGSFFRTRPLYRESSNPTSLRIHKETGSFVDFSTGQGGTLLKLLNLHGMVTDDKVKEFVETQNISLEEIKQKPKISFSKFLTFEEMGFCVNNFKYFKSRGISEETQNLFGIKYCTSGKMAGRAVVPLYNFDNEIIAFAGRSVFEDNPVKWKILGPKTEVVFPLHLNLKFIQESKSLIIVEGISDALTLWEMGIKNVICLFGTKMSTAIKNFLIACGIEKIIISTNNEPDNNFIGNKAAKSVYNSLLKYFNASKLKIHLPPKKDFGDCSLEEVQNWFKEI